MKATTQPFASDGNQFLATGGTDTQVPGPQRLSQGCMKIKIKVIVRLQNMSICILAWVYNHNVPTSTPQRGCHMGPGGGGGLGSGRQLAPQLTVGRRPLGGGGGGGLEGGFREGRRGGGLGGAGGGGSGRVVWGGGVQVGQFGVMGGEWSRWGHLAQS